MNLGLFITRKFHFYFVPVPKKKHTSVSRKNNANVGSKHFF